MSNHEALQQLRQKESNEEWTQLEQRWEAREKEIAAMRKEAAVMRKEAAAERKEVEAHKKELALEHERFEARFRLRNQELALERERLEANIRDIHIDESTTEDKEGECCICRDPLTEPVFTPCGHVLDVDCLRRWMSSGPRRTCPVCRWHP
eukprot:55346-Eustigmatos_ZCMA.PRE.1